jgi:hypothetical protein
MGCMKTKINTSKGNQEQIIPELAVRAKSQVLNALLAPFFFMF